MADLSFDFSGRTAVVTGAGGGIGYAIASALLSAGCEVIAFDLKENPQNFPADGALYYRQGDLTDEETVKTLIEDLPSKRLDYIVNAAGIALMADDGSVVDMDLAVFEKTLRVNLMGAVYTSRYGVPRLLANASGSIVHIASVVGLRSMDNAMETGPLDGYQVSKAALVSLSRGLALTYGPQGIRSNTICPGAVWTPMTEHIYQDNSRVEKMAERTPLKRVGLPEDIANCALFLLSDAAAFVSGTDFTVDGGLMAKLS